MSPCWKTLSAAAAVGLSLCLSLLFAASTTNVRAAQAQSIPPIHAHHTQDAQVTRATKGHPTRLLLLKLINKGRAKLHVAPLKLSVRLSACSLRHSKAMAAVGEIYHDPADICVAHQISGENVGMSTGKTRVEGVKAINKAMFGEGPCPSACPTGSPEWAQHGHYYNLVNPKFHKVGLGIATQGRAVYVTEDFVG